MPLPRVVSAHRHPLMPHREVITQRLSRWPQRRGMNGAGFIPRLIQTSALKRAADRSAATLPVVIRPPRHRLTSHRDANACKQAHT